MADASTKIEVWRQDYNANRPPRALKGPEVALDCADLGRVPRAGVRRLGGTVKVVVLDNLGEGVLTPDVYDPAVNPLYRDVLAHYGVVAHPRHREAQVAAMFAEERPALGPLPVEPFRHYRLATAPSRSVAASKSKLRVGYYGAPPWWLGQRVQVQWNDLHVRLVMPSTGGPPP